ncbi:sensor histidine kinase [Nonomuraea sp. 10N515B]|uniref:sensor histidine kinase n=1 Tax=Nonomuraea sp. 10N515B TaxID=3457422 RepID=UPI003FCDC2F1
MSRIVHVDRADVMGAVLRGVRADLLTSARQPLPPMAGPRPLKWLPHVLIVLPAVLLAAAAEGSAAAPFAIAHAVILVSALRWPVPAWWLSMAFLAGTAATPYSPTLIGQPWPWFVHAGVLFLVALRNRPRVAVETLLLSGLLAGGMQWPGGDLLWERPLTPAVIFAVAVFLGTSAHSRRETRQRLQVQQAATIAERGRRALLEERARIARELHDVVAHHMSVISVQADAAPYRVEDPPEELVNAFAVIRQNALEALTELRHVLGVLRAEATDDSPAPGGPQPTLDQLGSVVANVRSAGLRVELDVSGTARPLPPGVELSAFRIVQEALSNALRHAPSSTVRVEVAYALSTLRLRVLNGPSRDKTRPSPGAGHGIMGMRERAAMLGGELAAGPTPGDGYEVSVLLPVPVDTATTAKEGHT